MKQPTTPANNPNAPTAVRSSDLLGSKNPTLQGFEPTALEAVREMPIQCRVDRAIALLKAHEPTEGYAVAFSGGKDSCAIKKLCQMAGVKFDAFYKQTTIDPPELVRFLKDQHADVKWILPEHGNMMTRVMNKNAAPPTRMVRWCCEEYKENGHHGRVSVMGVRASESANRAKRWSEVTTDHLKNKVVCPIVLWDDAQLWEFLRAYEVPYCKLYDEGWTRLGCVGCPLNDESRLKEFKRWPAFERNWKKSVIGNWEKWKDVPNKKGNPRFQARFKTGEDFWQWWMKEKTPDVMRDCQTMLLWTNEPSE